MDDKLKVQHWLFLLFVMSLPLATLLQFRVGGAELQLADPLFVATAMVWSAAVLLGNARIRWSWFYLPLAAYALASICSTLAPADPHSSQVKLVCKFYLIAIAFLSFNLLTSTRMLTRVLQSWMIGAGIMIVCSVLGIILFYGGLRDPDVNLVIHPIFGSLPPGNYPRIEGFFEYPAVLCNFLAVTWAFALLMHSTGRLGSRKFWALAAGLIIVDPFTLTPGLGGIFLATSYFLFDRSRRGGHIVWGRLTMAAGVMIAAMFFFVASVTLFTHGANGSEMPIASGTIQPSHRAEAWSMAFDTFRQYPMFGRGSGTPVAGVVFKGPEGNHLLTDAHNIYLSTLGESGLVGFLTFFGIVGFLFYRLMRMIADDNETQTVRICLLLALTDAVLYQGLTGSYEDMRHLWVLFGVTAAVCEAALLSSRETPD